jgi:protein-arginine kinase activator protein McsA
MKCQNCSSAEYQDGLDTCIENGIKHRVYICPECDDIYTEPLISKHKHYRFNKAKFSDSVAILATMCVVFSLVYYIGSHLDKFTTIYR